MINFILWKWNDNKWASSYNHTHVNTMADMIRRNYKGKHKIYCITDDAEGIRDDINIIPMWEHLAELGHCYRRLFAFSKDFEKIIKGKIVSVDLDAVITSDLTEVIDNSPDFAISKDFQKGTPYNGSFWILQTGTRTQVWDNFKGKETIIAAKKKGYCACDQAIMAYTLGENERVLDENDGFMSYKYYILRENKGVLPDNAKFVAFHGSLKPYDKSLKNIEWIQSNYRPTKRAIVLGGASCVQSDLESLGNIPDDCDIIAVNDAGYGYGGKISIWATLHPEKFNKWKQKRKDNGYDMNFTSVGYGNKKRNIIPESTDEYSDDWRGSSGLFACKVALERGYEEIILCGVPMSHEKNMFSGKKWDDCENYRKGWNKHIDKLKGKVYSMSGWTKEILGGF